MIQHNKLNNSTLNSGSSSALLVLQSEWKALMGLCLFHIFIIALSNYMVQFTINIGGIDTTFGSFTFPFIFLSTDLTIRVFGASLARKIIAWTMLPALAVSYVVSVVFQSGVFLGPDALSVFNLFVFRIALASFTAYVVGQLLDIFVFNTLRQKKSWWVAPSCAATIGSAVDTLVFFFIAFYACEDEFLAAHWFSLGLVDYVTKIIICGLFFLPAYGVILKALTRKLQSNPALAST